MSRTSFWINVDDLSSCLGWIPAQRGKVLIIRGPNFGLVGMVDFMFG